LGPGDWLKQGEGGKKKGQSGRLEPRQHQTPEKSARNAMKRRKKKKNNQNDLTKIEDCHHARVTLG